MMNTYNDEPCGPEKAEGITAKIDRINEVIYIVEKNINELKIQLYPCLARCDTQIDKNECGTVPNISEPTFIEKLHGIQLRLNSLNYSISDIHNKLLL